MATVETRFNAALANIATNSIHIRMNVMECCRTCVDHEKMGLPNAEALDTTPWAYHYGGQGNELVWKNGTPYRRDRDDDDYTVSHVADVPTSKVYFGHGGPSLVAAQAVADAFRGEGFTVEWDGTEDETVIVNLD